MSGRAPYSGGGPPLLIKALIFFARDHPEKIKALDSKALVEEIQLLYDALFQRAEREARQGLMTPPRQGKNAGLRNEIPGDYDFHELDFALGIQALIMRAEKRRRGAPRKPESKDVQRALFMDEYHKLLVARGRDFPDKECIAVLRELKVDPDLFSTMTTIKAIASSTSRGRTQRGLPPRPRSLAKK